MPSALSKISKNKPDLIKLIHAKSKVDPIVIEKCLDAFILVVKDMLQRGESLNLRNFGTFMLKKRSSKLGRNFETNSSVLIPEHFVPCFKPSKNFAKRIKKKSSQLLKGNKK